MIRAIASSTACSGLMPSAATRWMAFWPNPLLVDAAVAPNVAVCGFVTQWFYTARLRSQIKPEDEAGARP